MNLDDIKAILEEREKEERKFWLTRSVKATLAAELPFWLMIEPCEIDLFVDDCPARASIVQGLVAYHEGELCLQTNNNLIAVVSDGGRLPLSEEKRLESVGTTVKRLMKTTVEFDVEVHESVIKAWNQRKTVSSSDNAGIALVNLALQYMSALAYAHLPFVNRLIYAYRSTSFDPFAFEVSEWDLANWYIETEDSICLVNLMPYQSLDSLPDIGTFGESARRSYFATSPEEVQSQVKTVLAPGKPQILDAKSLLIRGRFSEAIRSAVTAIEVSVEAKVRTLLMKRRMTDEQIRSKLDETRMEFFERVRRLQVLIGRRIPGPRVFWDWLNNESTDPPLAPYLNGVQLTKELDRVRRIRHDIVHRGLGISIFDRGPALRAIETMSWLFEWLEPSDPFGEEIANYGFYSTMRGQFTLDATFTTEGVRVREPKREWGNDAEFPRDYLIKQYVESLSTDNPDVDLFAAMTLSALTVPYSDADPTVHRSRLAHEQLWATINGKDTIVFALEPGTQLDSYAVSQLIQRKQAAELNSGRRIRSLVLLPDATSLFGDAALDSSVAEKLRLFQWADITLVDANRMTGCIVAMNDYGWDKQWIVEQLSRSGFVECIPKVFSVIGTVKRPLPRHSAVSIALREGSEFELGDRMMFLVANRFVEFEPLTIEVNRQVVERVVGPADFGAQVPDGVTPLKNNWIVYKRRSGRHTADPAAAMPN